MKSIDDVHHGAQTVAASAVIAAFLCFAFAYFFSALARAVTATLAPVLNAELGLSAGDLGLLAGAYFLGFASLQLPLGRALDRLGPKRVLIAFLALAVLGCAAFALARGFVTLVLARVLIGMGVGACLMAPMKSFREHLPASVQLRATSWMLMTGSLGMIASTLPVQWLLPSIGWRGLFWLLAAAFVLAMSMIAAFVPRDRPALPQQAEEQGYLGIVRQRGFMRYVPLGFFNYGGMVAVQSLWAGPWLTQVCGFTPAEAAAGLFGINSAMLFTFMAWGGLLPRLYQRGWTAPRLNRARPSAQPARTVGRSPCRCRRHCMGVGGLLRHQHVCFVGAAQHRSVFSRAAGGSRNIGLQPGHFCRRVRGSMGCRAGH